jgi:hypothetical protein
MKTADSASVPLRLDVSSLPAGFANHHRLYAYDRVLRLT